MLEFIISVVLFTVILLFLTLIILWVRARLVPQGGVMIMVNGEREIKAAAGALRIVHVRNRTHSTINGSTSAFSRDISLYG